MRKHIILWITLILASVLSACSNNDANSENKQIKIGIMFSDAGLGDQSFSDLGFAGLEKARDELNVSFDYREIKHTDTYEKGFEELIEQENDLIIGLGFSVQESLEKVANENPKTTFLLIDGKSDLPNVYNVSFKEEEASYLIGALAGLKTTTNVVGFVGGEEIPLIKKFESGFIQGVKSVNPEAEVLSKFSGSFSDDKLGASIANEMISAKADFIYPAAGFTGVGVILESQRAGTYSFGVDSDQFYLAEKAVVSSMLKQVDIAIYTTVKELVETGNISEKNQELGIKENGVNIAPIRIIKLSSSEKNMLEKIKEDISNGSIIIKE
ncbi:BMP family ABC transporter substrate-binding protein [Psychrobacillus sp. FJAT-51614]|uniref:BMP family ABC transporter substrate-binding protein n=1 Tax=Psychrobacillus mangrovi TaxID=3117745 RepID=A0ABU8F9C8_9BACI